MKKIVSGIIALACATSMFAVDFAAKVSMEGDVASGVIDINDKDQATATKDGTLNFWNLGAVNQYDGKEFLTLTGNGDKSGATVAIGYPYKGTGDDMGLTVRGASLWFKPIDMVKVTIGNVEDITLRETMDYWKVPDGMAAAGHQTYSWSSYATVSGPGILAEVTPISGLRISAGIAAGTAKNFAELKFNEKEDETYTAWGIAAMYNLQGVINQPINVAVSFRDAGKDGVKIAAIGAEYGNRYGDGFYGMVNARFRLENWSYSYIDESTKTPAFIGTKHELTVENALQAVAFDTMFRYAAGSFNVMARFPVTIRTVQNAKAIENGYKDPSWMSYEIKASYGIGAFTPYLDIENDNAVTFDDNFTESVLKMNVQPGVSFNVGACALDLGLKIAVPNAKGTNLNWSIPFTTSVAF